MPAPTSAAPVQPVHPARGQTLTLSTRSDRLFFGESGHGIARYDQVRYPQLLKLNEKMQAFYWRPVEIDVSMERKDFERMTDAERFVFTSNLRRQIVLDSIQGRSPSMVFLPHVTDPALENCVVTWGFFETIHSESYTHIIRSVYADPGEVFDGIPDVQPIVDCSVAIRAAYDRMIAHPTKENLYLALVAANALEGLRFYVSFSNTFSFAERGLVEGSAKINKLIARDENQHLAVTQSAIKLAQAEDPEFRQIVLDNAQQAREIFAETAAQEKAWGRYILSKGSLLGFSEAIFDRYVDYLDDKRQVAIGLRASRKFSKQDHPIPWVEKWFKNDNVQVAPQEVEIASYLSNNVVDDAAGAEFSL
jgi:ribonucleoside-diphosphate reductase beta chain